MSTVVDARLPAETFALAQSLTDNPSARFEFGRASARVSDDMPFLWGSGGDLDGLYDSLQSDASVEDVAVLTRFDEEFLFEVEWCPRVHRLLDAVLDHDESVLLNAYSSGSEWCFRLVYPEQVCVESVRQACRDMGARLDVSRVYALSAAFPPDQFQLTEKQYETILAAYEAGYYDIPRQINLKQLGDRLDISHQALSERLRRGHEELMANSLGMGVDDSTLADGEPAPQLNVPSLADTDTE